MSGAVRNGKKPQRIRPARPVYMMVDFLEAYLLEIMLLAGCFLSGPLARLIVSYESHAHAQDTKRALGDIRRFFIIMFGSLLLVSLMLFEH